MTDLELLRNISNKIDDIKSDVPGLVKKVDKLEGKFDALAKSIAEAQVDKAAHEIRIQHLEADARDFKAWRAGLLIKVLTIAGGIAGVITFLAQFFQWLAK